MKKSDILMSFLREEGYVPKQDEDGDIIFKREGITFIIFTNEDDEDYVSLDIPNMWEIKSPDERQQVLVAAAEVQGEFKLVKVTPRGKSVWTSVELLVNPFENVGKVLPRALITLSMARSRFAEVMQANQ